MTEKNINIAVSDRFAHKKEFNFIEKRSSIKKL